MKTAKNAFASKITAATLGLALVATPVPALARDTDAPEPVVAPLSVCAPHGGGEKAWAARLAYDDWVAGGALDAFCAVFRGSLVSRSPWATPREQLRAILVALRHARHNAFASQVTGVKPYYKGGLRLVDVTLSGGGVRYVCTVEAATGRIVGLSTRQQTPPEQKDPQT